MTVKRLIQKALVILKCEPASDDAEVNVPDLLEAVRRLQRGHKRHNVVEPAA